jgi:hypothetical protein
MGQMAGAIVGNIGSKVSAYGQYRAGRDTREAKRREAEQIERNVRNQYAADILQAREVRREGDRLISDARAAIAASGGVTTDAGSIDILSKLDRDIEYNRMATLYDAEFRKRGGFAQAAAVRKEGRNAFRAGLYAAKATQMAGSADTMNSFGGMMGGMGGGG